MGGRSEIFVVLDLVEKLNRKSQKLNRSNRYFNPGKMQNRTEFDDDKTVLFTYSVYNTKKLNYA